MPFAWWKVRLLLGYTGAIAGAAFLLLALGFAVYEAIFLTHSATVKGSVIANISTQTMSSDPESGAVVETSYCPEFRYRSEDGRVWTTTSSACSSPPVFAVGEEVQVRYLPARPDWAQTDTFGAKWGMVLGFLVPAAALLAIGAFLLSRLRSQGFSLDPFGFRGPV